MKSKYDYLIVGAGLYGGVFAQQMLENGKRCLVLDRRDHIAGNMHCEEIAGIRVHKYGPHIFHTSMEEVWSYVNRFADFNAFVNAPIAFADGKMYNLPFNMNTFSQLWGVHTPQEAFTRIKNETAPYRLVEPKNLEQQALKLVGKDIYHTFIKGYTQKQWGRDCTELPAFIIRRLPLRYTYNNNYYDDIYQGIPINGYDSVVANMLTGADVLLNTDYFDFIKHNEDIATTTVFSGMIDEFFQYCFGRLQYRTVTFEEEVIECENWQGNAVVNYPDASVPYTRIIEHKHFEFGTQPHTVISREYPCEWMPGMEPYYPVNDERNQNLYFQYREMAKQTSNVVIGGRLGGYRYENMDEVIFQALQDAAHEIRQC